jgi:hypothetical protein
VAANGAAGAPTALNVKDKLPVFVQVRVFTTCVPTADEPKARVVTEEVSLAGATPVPEREITPLPALLLRVRSDKRGSVHLVPLSPRQGA